MSVVFDGRDVSAVGPTLGLDVVTSSPAYVADGPGGVPPPPDNQGLVSCFTSFDFGIASENKSEASSESSSIGAPEDSDEDEDDEEDEVESKSNGSLASLASLEECLPIKSVSSSFYLQSLESSLLLTIPPKSGRNSLNCRSDTQQERIIKELFREIKVVREFIRGEDGERHRKARESIEQEAEDDDRLQVVEEIVFLWRRGKP
ncbi:hypothetical protein U1Q18_018469 [Sarracenia purpurea var. burkii]